MQYFLQTAVEKSHQNWKDRDVMTAVSYTTNHENLKLPFEHQLCHDSFFCCCLAFNGLFWIIIWHFIKCWKQKETRLCVGATPNSSFVSFVSTVALGIILFKAALAVQKKKKRSIFVIFHIILYATNWHINERE